MIEQKIIQKIEIKLMFITKHESYNRLSNETKNKLIESK